MRQQHLSSLYRNRHPVRDIALRTLRSPERAQFLRDIAAGKITADEATTQHPHYGALAGQALIRFYSSYKRRKRRKPWFGVFVLAKGKQVLEEMDLMESYVYLMGR